MSARVAWRAPGVASRSTPANPMRYVSSKKDCLGAQQHALRRGQSSFDYNTNRHALSDIQITHASLPLTAPACIRGGAYRRRAISLTQRSRSRRSWRIWSSANPRVKMRSRASTDRPCVNPSLPTDAIASA
jgi:hypothetical protein